MLDILVTGANGQLGNEMRILGSASGNRYIYTDVAELDITDADAVGIVRRELRHGMAGEAVALDKHRPLFGDGHVPGHKAHLGHLLGGPEAHGLGLLKEGHLKAHDGRVRHGVLGVGVALLVRADGEQLSAFQVHARGHAALVDVVHDLAVADAQEGVDDALLLVAQEGGDADGVNGGGAEGHQAGMLDDPLLDDADLSVQQFL